MTRFFELNPTDDEIKAIADLPRSDLAGHYDTTLPSDGELFMSATLLAHRGERRGAFKAIDEIEDEDYREEMRQILQSEIDLPIGAVW